MVQSKVKKRALLCCAALLFTLLSFGIFSDYFNERYEDVQVTLHAAADKNSASQGKEVWLEAIIANEKPVALSSVLSEGTGWEIKDHLLFSTGARDNKLSFTLPHVKDLTLQFYRSGWSGKINVCINGVSDKTDLFSNDQAFYFERYHGREKPGAPLFPAFFSPPAFFLIFLLAYYGAFAAAERYKLFLLPYGLIYLNLIGIQFKYHILLWKSSVFLFLLGGAFLIWGYRSPLMKKYYTRRNMILIAGASLFAAFAVLAARLFLKVAYIDGSAEAISCYLMAACFTAPVLLASLYLLEEASKRLCVRGRAATGASWGWGLVIFLIFCSVWGVYLYAYYPGVMTPDTFDQWTQAKGTIPLNNQHPVFHTLILRSLMGLLSVPSPIIKCGCCFSPFFSRCYAIMVC